MHFSASLLDFGSSSWHSSFSLYLAAQNDFNKASLETLNAAAEILGVKYDRVKRK